MELARVVKVHKDLYELNCKGEELKGKVSGRFSYIITGTGDYPCVGDFVIITRSHDLAVIHKVCSRYSELSRSGKDATSNRQVMASNIDIVFICISLNNDFNLKKINRFLSIVYGSGAKPIILLTKNDLIDNAEEKIDHIKNIDDTIDIYSISAFNQEDIVLVKNLVKNKTCVFLGASGVGKSTLVNNILGEEVLVTSNVRETDDQGRHTTTHREMFFIEDLDAAIIDTPGIRTIQTFITENLEMHYNDIFELSKQCKFSNCKHESEPDCAVQRAIDEGTLPIERFESYKKTLKINEYNIRREKQRELKMKSKRK